MPSPRSDYVFASSVSPDAKSRLLSGDISAKLATNIHHVTGNCWKQFSRSEVKGQGHLPDELTYHGGNISTVWRRGALVWNKEWI